MWLSAADRRLAIQAIYAFPAGRPAGAPAGDPIAHAQERWKPIPDLSFTVHPVLASWIGDILPTFADSPAVDPRLGERLRTEADQLHRLALAPGPDPKQAPFVAITQPRTVVTLVVASLHTISQSPDAPEPLRTLAHTEGQRIQGLVRDSADLFTPIDAGWRPPAQPPT